MSEWPKSKRCISTLGCAEFDFAELNRFCECFALPLVEIRAVEDRLDLPTLFREQFQNPQGLRRAATDWNFRVPVMDSSFVLAKGQEESARQELLDLAEWTDAIDTPWIRVFDGGDFTAKAGDESFAPLIESLDWWRAEKSRRGFRCDLVVETHNLLRSSHNVLRLQALLSEPAAILWDTWHIWFHNHEPIQETWAAIGSHVHHIHFKDGIHKPSERHPFSYQIPGQGLFELSGLFRMLEAEGYAGAISLEWERKWHPYLPPLAEAVAGALTVR